MGVLKTQSTLTIAVWSSILLHTAAFLGFELAFSNKSKPFPKSEPRTVTIVSIDTAARPLAPLLNTAQRKNITSSLEKAVANELLQVPEDSLETEVMPENAIAQELVPLNDNSNYPDLSLSYADKGDIGENLAGKEKTGIREPVPVREIVPAYPFRARKKGYEGIVTLDVVVSVQGVPLSCSIADSSGFKDLDKAAEDTILASLFYPGTINGEQIESTLRIHISFRLNKS